VKAPAGPWSSPSAGSRRRPEAEKLGGRLPPLLVAADRVASTVAQGVHGRRRVGLGESFWQFRRYEPGDPVTRIDWRQSGRSRHVFVRETEWEAAQSVWLWRDASNSMDYHSSRTVPTKRERAEVLLLALAILLNRAGERVALIGGGQAPATGRATLDRIVADLDHGTTSLEPPLDPAIPRHAAVVMFGDLLSPPETLARTVGAYAARAVDGCLVQILDPAEETLPFAGRIRFDGYEGEGGPLIPRVETVRGDYARRLEAHRRGVAELARATGWRLILHRTDRPPESALLALWAALAADRNAGRRA
jgi:uncharacterized protein (DUF58 family)